MYLYLTEQQKAQLNAMLRGKIKVTLDNYEPHKVGCIEQVTKNTPLFHDNYPFFVMSVKEAKRQMRVFGFIMDENGAY